jgi:hypothetical protein
MTPMTLMTLLIRAFAPLSLSLSLLAACIASSHASPPPAQLQGAWATSATPEDPYGQGQSVAFAGQSCGPNSTCSFECPGGGCAYSCAEGSTCNIECDGGNCRLSCGYNATCNLECDGGQCGTGCGAGATCNLECDGGSCAHACAPDATCNTECGGGNCRS